MGKVIVVERISLDGVMQAPGTDKEDTRGGFKRGGWAVPYSDAVMGAKMAEGMAGPGALLLGRRTYRAGQWRAGREPRSGGWWTDTSC